jgi:hypothetical protein
MLGVKGDDGHTYYCAPKKFTEIPTTVGASRLPKDIVEKSPPADTEQQDQNQSDLPPVQAPVQ